MFTISMKRRLNRDGVLVYRATVRDTGSIREIIESPNRRLVRRMLRRIGYKVV